MHGAVGWNVRHLIQRRWITDIHFLLVKLDVPRKASKSCGIVDCAQVTNDRTLGLRSERAAIDSGTNESNSHLPVSWACRECKVIFEISGWWLKRMFKGNVIMTPRHG